jgi:recombination protein RecT
MANAKTTMKPKADQAQQQQPGPAPQGNVTAQEVEPKSKHPIVKFKNYADQRMATLGNALPPHISPDTFMSIALTAIQRKADLMRCTPQSLWNACIDAANLGLLPDGVEGAIAPYGQNIEGKRVAENATFMPMVGGYRKKAYEGGLVAKWEVNIVRARDVFNFRLGDDPFIDHTPYWGAEDPGEVIGAYSIATLKDGSVLRDVMTIWELNKIRAKSKALANGPWSDPAFVPEMHRKTMARRHFKQLPRTPALAKIIEHDDKEFDLDHRSEEAIEDRRARRLTSTSAAFDQFSRPGPVIDNDDFGSVDGDADDHEQPGQDGDGEFDEGDADNGGQPTAGGAQASGDTGDTQQQDGGESSGQQGGGQVDQPKRWDVTKQPTNEAEYSLYAETVIADWTGKTEFDTGTMKIVGSEALKSWWKSDAERKLRTACKVAKEAFDALVEIVKAREAAIKAGK